MTRWSGRSEGRASVLRRITWRSVPSFWQELRTVARNMRELPEFVAWRMDAWTTKMRDLQEGTGLDVLH